MNAFLRGWQENRAETDPASEDVRLTGRTYTIPFENVWQASLSLVDRGILGWTLSRSDDRKGIIAALAKTPVVKAETDIKIRVGLDRMGQTRVDVIAVSRKDRGDWGRTRRLIGRFLKHLDKKLGAEGSTIIDPLRHPGYQEFQGSA